MKKIILKKKKAKNSDKYNEKRKQQYTEDTKYRENVKTKSRSVYRKRSNVELMRHDRNRDALDTLAEELSVTTLDGKNVRLPVMNVPTMSKAIEVLYQTAWRWMNKGLIPEPILFLTNNSQPVYHVKEVEVFIDVIGKHLADFAYYRKDHESTKKKVFSGVHKVRKQLKLIKE